MAAQAQAQVPSHGVAPTAAVHGQQLTAAQKSARDAWLKLDATRQEKWTEMLDHWHVWSVGQPKRLKIRCRKGIPDSIRGKAWLRITGADARLNDNKGVYRILLSAPIEGRAGADSGRLSPSSGGVDAAAMGVGPAGANALPSSISQPPSALAQVAADVLSERLNTSASTSIASYPSSMASFNVKTWFDATSNVSGTGTPSSPMSIPPPAMQQLVAAPIQRDIIDTIERDISRTFPQQAMFKDAGGYGQAALFRVLTAYARIDPAVGYCQGMGFVTALFLSYLSEEEAFWLLLTVMQSDKHGLAQLYAPGLPLVDRYMHLLQGLLNRYQPKLAAHIRHFDIHPTMYATQWVLTIFTYSWPFPLVVRIWDAFLFEGWKSAFRAALAALKLHEKVLMGASSFEALMGAFKTLPTVLAGVHPVESAGLGPAVAAAAATAGRSSGASATVVPATMDASNNQPSTESFGPAGTGRAALSSLSAYLPDGGLDTAEKIVASSLKIKFKNRDLVTLQHEYDALRDSKSATCGGDAGALLFRRGEKRLPPAAQKLLHDKTHEQVAVAPAIGGGKATAAANDASRPSAVSWGKGALS